MNRHLNKMFSIFTILALVLMALPVQSARAAGPVSLSTLDVPYTQNFDTLPASGSATWINNSTIPGWFHARTGTGTTIVANDGSSNAGNLYSYGTGTATDRALGSIGSTNTAAGNFFWGVRLSNDTGATITSLDVSYTGEQWRNSAAVGQTVAFSYLVGSPTVTGSLAEFQLPGLAVAPLNFTSPITGGTAGALDGNAAANRVAISATISGLNIPAGAEVMLRWSDPDHAGSDHGLSIDDFSVTPHSVVLPSLTINDVSANEGNLGTSTFDFTVSLSPAAGPGGVTFDIATANGTATTADNDYQTNSLTGQTIPAGNTNYNFSVLVNSDTTDESNETFFVNVTNVSGASLVDGQGQGTIQNDDAPVQPPAGSVVISEVYGGGGNASAPFKNDYIELYNRTAGTISLAGWSVQYASATGSTWQVTPLTGSIGPGKYYLVAEAAGTSCSGSPCGVDLPTPEVTGTILMSGTAGKVALVQNTTPLSGTCPTGLPLSDFVGYGTTASCFEGSGPTSAPSNTTAVIRLADGATDTDNNAADFVTGAPDPDNGTDPAPTVSSTTPANGAANVALISNIDITFSEPVNVSGSWFTISCGTSGTHTAVVSGGPTTFTLNPDTDFVTTETCTVTIVAAQVSDQDTDDPYDSMLADYVFSFGTEGPVCTQTFTPIYSIQGSGNSAAITGNVTTQGVVVGDFEGTAAASGFYLQDATGDGNAATSDGIFVFTGGANTVNAGDVVRVTGYARERFNLTALNGSNSNTDPVVNIVNCGTGSVAPVDVTMPFASATFPERYEGMLVRFPQPLVISEYFNYDRFGEVVLALPLPGEPRPFSGTAIDEPGAAANARTLANSLRRITLDDVQSAQNPPVLRHPDGTTFSLAHKFRGGDTLQNAVGVLGFDFSLYRIIPTGPADYTAVNPRPATPEPVGGSLRVAAMNTLNFFVTLDGIDDDPPAADNPADNICGGGANLECRGADFSQPTEFTRQRDKLLTALAGLDGDIIGLNELENTPGAEPMDSIVSGLTGYDYIHTGTIGTDAIKVGIIYRPTVVTPIGPFKVLTSAVDPRFIDTRSRPSLAQTFEVNATGARFTIVVNHLKSKGSACSGDPDAGDGQGNCNGTRTLAAQALVDWIATDPTGSGDPDFLIMGDLNSYAMEDPITAIKQGPDDTAGTADDYTNLISHFHGPYAYSYTFDGQAGYLDHALANASIFSQVTGAADWHINSDEPDILDYETSFKPAAQEALYEVNQYRTSDHDAVVLGLDLKAPPVANNDSYQTNEDTSLNVTAPGVLDNDTDPNNDTLTAVLVSDTTNGELTLNNDGSFSYIPNANFNGSDSFTYKANDGSFDSEVATVNITVNAVNDAPVATNDSYGTNEDTVLTVPASGVLSNDSDVENNSLTAVTVSQPSSGTLSLNANGSFTYTPNANYNGPDSFTYKANDGTDDSNVATVTITVNAVNDAPVCTSPQSGSTTEDMALNGSVVCADVDNATLTYSKVSNPSHGTATVNSNGTFTYTPSANYNGSDSFTFKANDGSLDSNVATFNIAIAPVNDNPVAVNDSVTIAKNTSGVIFILANDSDIDGDTLTVISFTQPAHGTISYSAKNKNFRYTPNRGFTGSDTFTYTISDGHGGTATGTVFITVQ